MRSGTEPPHVRLEVLELLTKIAEVIFITDDPLSQAYEIVRQTALSHAADIASLFLVEEHARIVLKAGVAYFRGREITLPKVHTYEIDWDATSEADMAGKGLTAFVAANGMALSIESYEELSNMQLHPAHSGRWDKLIYPEGVDHPETGFGCLYAVPLRRPPRGTPRDTVIGVFKIERRRNRPPFDRDDRKIFDLVAAHLSLLLQTYYRIQNRIFSDLAHAIGGGLGRTHVMLTTCQELLRHRHRDPNMVLDLISEELNSAIEIMTRACRRMDLVIDASRNPQRMTEESIGSLWESIVSDVELKLHLKLDSSKVILDLNSPITNKTKLHLHALEYSDLTSVLGNLLDNAIQYGVNQEPVTVSIMLFEDENRIKLVFRVVDRGQGIKPDIIEAVKTTSYGGIYPLTEIEDKKRGTGLFRVFELGKQHNWQINYKFDNGSIFEIITPDLREGDGN